MSGRQVYLAGASAELERCEQAVARLRELGHNITEDWCAAIREVDARNDMHGPTHTELYRAANRDLQAIAVADTFIILAPESPHTGGCFVELGYAIRLRATGAPLEAWWVGPPKSCFYTLVSRVFPAWEDLELAL